MSKILILANDFSTLFSFRQELINRLLLEKYEVILSLPPSEKNEFFREKGCQIIETKMERRGMNPIKDISVLRSYFKIIKQIKPDAVLTYTVKPNIYGGIVCKWKKTPYIANITGLGTAISKGDILSKLILKLYRYGLSECKCVFFQNAYNLEFAIKNKVVTECTQLLPGSGVNLEKNIFNTYPEEDKKLRFIYVSRIMKDKGMDELLDCIESLMGKYSDLEFKLAGMYEQVEYKNRLDALSKKGILQYIGNSDNVPALIKECHAIIHPSYHEGMSNVLLEAAAGGRPIIATDIPGCRETYIDGISGVSCKPRSRESLMNAIERFIELPYKEKVQMGIAGRKKIEKEFDRNIVVNTYLDEINTIVGR